MKVLLVKTSSLGDVVHALPAVTDALASLPELVLDWVVEEGFSDIPARHRGVRRTIPVAIRRWRKNPGSGLSEFFAFRRALREESYDLVIDSQGLLKSAFTGLLARGSIAGFDSGSARESAASWFYRQRYRVDTNQHAILRQKQLFAAALGYDCPDEINFGLIAGRDAGRRLMFFHGTTWASKEWPVSYWCELAKLANAQDYELMVPAGNDMERRRAELITESGGEVLFRPSLAELMETLASCQGAVSVDTGLGHLAPALAVPVVGIFGATSPALTGMLGADAKVIASTHLQCIPCRKRDCKFNPSGGKIHPPCYEPIQPEIVWQALQQQTGNPSTNLA